MDRLYWSCLAITVLGVVVLWGQSIETRFFPAASPARLVAALKTNRSEVSTGVAYHTKRGSYTAIWIETSRLRHPSCGFRRIDWFLGNRNARGNALIPVALGPPRNRGAGKFATGPWVIKIKKRRLSQTYADVFHQCSVFGINFPWLTRSKFYN